MIDQIVNGQYTPNGFTTRPNPPKPQESTPPKTINLDAFTWENGTLDRIQADVNNLKGTKDHGN
jgi:hypothetical protein